MQCVESDVSKNSFFTRCSLGLFKLGRDPRDTQPGNLQQRNCYEPQDKAYSTRCEDELVSFHTPRAISESSCTSESRSCKGCKAHELPSLLLIATLRNSEAGIRVQGCGSFQDCVLVFLGLPPLPSSQFLWEQISKRNTCAYIKKSDWF